MFLKRLAVQSSSIPKCWLSTFSQNFSLIDGMTFLVFELEEADGLPLRFGTDVDGLLMLLSFLTWGIAEGAGWSDALPSLPLPL
jgi:hypothetical protein